MVGFKSYIPTGTFSKAQFQMLLKMQKKKKKEKIKGRYRLFAIHFQYTTMATQFFDGISRILFVTPSNKCSIRLTPKSTGSQIKSREGRNVLRWYSPIPIRRMEFNGVNGIQRSPSMFIGITGLVINLTSDKCGINQICLVLNAMKRNSPF